MKQEGLLHRSVYKNKSYNGLAAHAEINVLHDKETDKIIQIHIIQKLLCKGIPPDDKSCYISTVWNSYFIITRVVIFKPETLRGLINQLTKMGI